MYSVLLQPLHQAILGAQFTRDPFVWHEAARRFLALDSQLRYLPLPERTQIESSLYRMLPTDWPLWMESYRLQRRHAA